MPRGASPRMPASPAKQFDAKRLSQRLDLERGAEEKKDKKKKKSAAAEEAKRQAEFAAIAARMEGSYGRGKAGGDRAQARRKPCVSVGVSSF